MSTTTKFTSIVMKTRMAVDKMCLGRLDTVVLLKVRMEIYFQEFMFLSCAPVDTRHDDATANAGVADYGCAALWNLANNADNKSKILAANGMSMVERMKLTWASNAGVQTKADRALGILQVGGSEGETKSNSTTDGASTVSFISFEIFHFCFSFMSNTTLFLAFFLSRWTRRRSWRESRRQRRRTTVEVCWTR